MKIGEKLKEGRKEINMTQEEVAQILHVSRSTVSSWEINRTYPDIEMLVALSDLYDISLDVMLREDDILIKRMTNEIRKSRKRKVWIVILCLILVPTLFYLGYQTWRASKVISPTQISEIQLDLNGELLNSQSEMIATVNVDSWHEYVGHWAEINEDRDTIIIQFYKKIDLFSEASEERINIPIDFDHSLSSQIESIEVTGFYNNQKILILLDK